MTFYEGYKPFRNYMRGFPAVATLIHLWAYAQHVVEGQPLAPGLAVGMPWTEGPLRSHIYPWDLEILARETILHSRPAGQLDMRRWRDLAYAVNHIRRLDEWLSANGALTAADVLLDLHRMAHRQFRWQDRQDMAAMVRALRIYGAGTINDIVFSDMGMTTREFVSLGAAVAGNFLSRWGMSTSTDYAVLGISQGASRRFFERITCNLEGLREQLAAGQSYDRSWLYTWNPLEQRPLVRYDQTKPDQVISPIPKYVLRRVTTGIFYDLINSKGFDHQYGVAFQDYIGSLCREFCSTPAFTLRQEREYRPKKGERRHGVDWVLSDASGHLFIECKTKRMSLGAKTLTDEDALEADLDAIASAIVQTYKNIRDVIEGLTEWAPGSLPIYPMVVTLEEWYLFNPRLQEKLNEKVNILLLGAKLSASLLTDMPYTVASAREFEFVVQIIARIGVAGLMRDKTKADANTCALLPYLQTKLPEYFRELKSVPFVDEALAIIPAV